MSDNEKNYYARLAKSAYNPKGSGLNYDPRFSDEESTLFIVDDQVIYAIRGSTTVYDWTNTNVLLVLGSIKQSNRYKKEKAKLLAIKNVYGPVDICGHSLGALIAFHLCMELPEYVKDAYIYNPGFSSEELKNSIFDKVFGRHTDSWKKIHMYRVSSDLVSFLSMPFAENQSSHTISNFGGSIEAVRQLTRRDVDELIYKYAPVHYMAFGDLNYVVRPIQYEKLPNTYFDYVIRKDTGPTLQIKPEHDRGAHYIAPYLRNLNHELGSYKCYVFVVPHTDGFMLAFSFCFIFNYGKRMNIPFHGNKRYASHVFDWTRSIVVFKNKNEPPVKTGFQYHRHKIESAYGSETYDFDGHRGNFIFEDDEGIKRYTYFHAFLGSEVYPMLGEFIYEEHGPIKLRDVTGKYFKLEPRKDYTIIMPENYLLESNIASDQDQKDYSLDMSASFPGLDNWCKLNYAGAGPRKKEHFGFGIGDQEQRVGLNRLPSSLYRDKYKQEQETGQIVSTFI